MGGLREGGAGARRVAQKGGAPTLWTQRRAREILEDVLPEDAALMVILTRSAPRTDPSRGLSLRLEAERLHHGRDRAPHAQDSRLAHHRRGGGLPEGRFGRRALHDLRQEAHDRQRLGVAHERPAGRRTLF